MEQQTINACKAAHDKFPRIPQSWIMAVVATESAGQTFADVHGRKEPVIRYEGHYFDQRLTGATRDQARKAGLASPTAGAVKNPNSQEARWDKLYLPACKINEEAATESLSAGVGQVMLAHDSKLGFKTAVEMFAYERKGVTEQVDVMMRYCDKFGLMDELERGDAAGFARGYNGSNFRKYKYDTTILSNAKKFAPYDQGSHPIVDGLSVAKPDARKAASTMLRMGTEGAAVTELQTLLNRAAVKYKLAAVKVDGDFGPSTKAAVVAFQIASGFVGKDVDGVAGPQTRAKLDAFKTEPDDNLGVPTLTQAAVQTPMGRAGTAATIAGTLATTVLEPAKQALGPLVGQNIPVVDHAFAAMTIGALLVAAYGVVSVGLGYRKANTTRGVDRA